MFENRDERGISNLIATLILIAVALVGGAFAYTAFRGQAQSTRTNADLQIQNARGIVTDGGENIHISTIIKNVGTQKLTVENVLVENPLHPDFGSEYYDLTKTGTGGVATPLDLGDIAPGETVSDGIEIANTVSSGGDTYQLYQPGNEYTVRVIASTPGEGNITDMITVRVERA